MNKDSTLKNKLKSYSALAGATLAGVAAHGQIVYTDVEPDVIIDEPGEFFDLDLNKDGITEFKLEYKNEALYSYSYGGMTSGTWMRGPIITGFGKGNRVLGKYWNKGWNQPYAFNDSTAIYGKFNKASRGLLRTTFNKFVNDFLLPEYQYTRGFFDSVANKYIGLEFYKGGNAHYGWIRVDVIPNEDDTHFTLRIKDYAFNNLPYNPIPAGVGSDVDTLPPPTNIVATDIDDSYTAEDCMVVFDASLADSVVSEYGIVAIKSENADDITLQDLIDSEGGNPTSVTPDGSPAYKATLNLGMLDIDGDPIIMGRAYKMLVYAYNFEGLYIPSWNFSNEITLSTSNEIASDIVAEDISDNNDASDMRVSFTPAGDETNIEEYRIMIVRENMLDQFDSTTAANVVAARYTNVVPDGNDKQITLDAAALDYQGNTINQTTNYYAFVVSVLKSAAGFRISTPSNIIQLTIAAPTITVITANDIDNSGTPYDVEVKYMVPEFDTSFSYVRFIVLPSDEIDGLDDEKIMNLSSTWSKHVSNYSAFGVMDTVRLYPYAYDGYMSPIIEGRQYTLWPVVSPAGGNNVKTLGSSTEFMLTSPIDTLDQVLAVTVANKFTPSDWKIYMNAAQKESHVAEYRIIAVKSSDVAGFNLAVAEAVASGNYVVVMPTGTNIEKVMPADLKDSEGMAIDRNEDYQFFVLAVGNSKASVSALSEPSNSVTLIKYTSITQQIAELSKLYFNNGDLHIEIPGLNKAANVVITSMNGSTVYNDRLEIGQQIINPGSLASGVYVVNVHSEEFVLTRKLIVK